MFPDGLTAIFDVSDDPNQWSESTSSVRVPRAVVREEGGEPVIVLNPATEVDGPRVVYVTVESLEEDGGDKDGPGLTIKCSHCGATFWFRRLSASEAARLRPLRDTEEYQ